MPLLLLEMMVMKMTCREAFLPVIGGRNGGRDYTERVKKKTRRSREKQSKVFLNIEALAHLK